MTNKQIPFAIVGILVGFVAGFFVGQVIVPPSSNFFAEKEKPSPGQSSIPENHPSPDFIKQLQALQKHVEEHPKDRQGRISLGNTFYDMGRFDVAIRWYEEAIAMGEPDPNVITDLGTSYFYSGNPEKAIELFHRSIAIEKDHPQTLQNLGWVQFQSKNYKAAIEAWGKLIQAHPEYEQIDAIRQQLQIAREQLKGESS